MCSAIQCAHSLTDCVFSLMLVMLVLSKLVTAFSHLLALPPSVTPTFPCKSKSSLRTSEWPPSPAVPYHNVCSQRRCEQTRNRMSL